MKWFLANYPTDDTVIKVSTVSPLPSSVGLQGELSPALIIVGENDVLNR